MTWAPFAARPWSAVSSSRPSAARSSRSTRSGSRPDASLDLGDRCPPRHAPLRPQGGRGARRGAARWRGGGLRPDGPGAHADGRPRRCRVRPGDARRGDRPPRAHGTRRARRRARPRRARPGHGRALVPGAPRPAQRVHARDDVRRLHPARRVRRGTTTSTTRSSGSCAARVNSTSAGRWRRSGAQ